jgi:hypothetical protein
MIEKNDVEFNIESHDRTYTVGEMIVVRGLLTNTPCIIAQTSPDHVQLISLENGNRWDDAVQVHDVTNIDYDTILTMAHGYAFDVLKRAVLSRGK